MSSDETHEQIIEHRHTMRVDDGVVTTISESDTPVCGTCWRYVQHDDEHQTTEYVRVPWPCEVARLRERLAELESLLREIHADYRYDWATGSGDERRLEDRVRAALAQADETGGAR